MSLAFEKPLRRLPAPFSLICALALAAPIGAGCGGDDDDGTAVDAGDGEVDAGDGDVDASVGCVPTDVLPNDFRPIAEVAEPDLTSTTDEGVTAAVIDATAGGFFESADNPFIYIDLETGVKVDVDDVDALTSTEWDIAFKRSTIRLNGGDSGPGGVGLVVVEGGFDDVTEPPADVEYEEDEWVDENCELVAERDGTPASAFHEWYDYADKTMTLTPKAIVHVIRTRSGGFVKLVIDNYYDETGEERISAVYSVRWAAL
jgi:hypothetical protein